MKNQFPKVSVVIPTFNRQDLLLRSINSVLAQTYKDFELIIVDDCSIDSTQERVLSIQDQRVKYLRHEKNLGASSARNTGVKSSLGEWIAFQDSDDLWLETKLEKQMQVALKLSEDFGVIHCGVQYFDHITGKDLTKWIVRDNINSAVLDNIGAIPGTPTMLIRKSVFADVGYFDETLPSHEESELGIRIAKKYKFKLVDEFLVRSTKNHAQITANNEFFTNAKEIILNKHREILGKKQIARFSVIIAGNSIVKGDFIKAKKYLLDAIKYDPFQLKPFVSYLMIIAVPNFVRKIYINRYEKKHLI